MSNWTRKLRRNIERWSGERWRPRQRPAKVRKANNPRSRRNKGR